MKKRIHNSRIHHTSDDNPYILHCDSWFEWEISDMQEPIDKNKLVIILSQLSFRMKLNLNSWGPASQNMEKCKESLFGNFVRIGNVYFEVESYNNSNARDCDQGSIYQRVSKRKVLTALQNQLRELTSAIDLLKKEKR